MEKIVSDALVGESLDGLPIKTRSKVAKSMICKALGYPVPPSFAKSRPRFPGQNFDVFTQKSLNVQIWNEDVDANRRYVFLKVDDNNIITNVRVINGETLSQYDRTGKLTTKYQAAMRSYRDSRLFSGDSTKVSDWISGKSATLSGVHPNDYPTPDQLLPIVEVYNRLLPLVGRSIHYRNSLQERNRSAELQTIICRRLGYSIYEDDGTYPDIANRLIEIKLQTSPTIDLGLYSPEDGSSIVTIGDTTFSSEDVRYVIFDGAIEDRYVRLNRLYVVSGYAFTNYFPRFQGKGQNAKIQLPLPHDFFD